MSKLKGAVKTGSLLGIFSVLVLALVLLNPGTESAPVNLTRYQIMNTTASINGSNVDGGGTTTLIEANDTSVAITINVTMTDEPGGGGAGNLVNISRVTVTFPDYNIVGRTNFTYQASSNNTTATAPVLSQFFNETRGGNFNDVSVSSVINLTWNVTAAWTAGLIQNTSAGGLAGNTSRNFTFNLSTTPNATAVYVFNISTNNGTTGTLLATGGAYNVSAFRVQVVDRIAPINLLAVDGPYGSQRTARNRVFNESPNAINATNNLTVGVNFTITEPLLSNAGMQICVNATSTDGSTANSTCFNQTATAANMFKSLSTSYAVVQTGFPTSQNGMYNLTLFAYDNGTVGTDTNGGNANFTRTSARNTTFFWIVDDTGPSNTLTVTSGGISVDGKSAVPVGSSLKIDCTAQDGHSGLVSSALTITEPDGIVISNKNCGDTYTPLSVKSRADAYTVELSSRNGANVNSSSKVYFGTDYASKPASSPSSKSGSTPVSNPAVLASKTLTVTESATPAKPLDLTPSAELISQGLTKLQITVSKEVVAADATVEVKALKQIPTTDEAGQTLTALPSDSQIPLKVLQITPSAVLKDSTTKATITFTLNKTELGTTDPSTIVLARFTGGKWVELPTTAGSPKPDGSVDFTSETPGFSVFVVTTKAPAVQSEPSSTSPPSSGSTTPAATATPTPAPKAAEGVPTMALIAIVVVVIILVVVVMMTKRKK